MTFNHFRFEDPYWFLLLIPLWGALWYFCRWNGRSSVLFSSVHPFRFLSVSLRQRFLPAVPILFFLGGTCLVVALARPQSGQEDYRVRSEGIDMAICLDRSGSMQAMDFTLGGKRADRLTIVKKIFHDFVLGSADFPGRPDDRISLISFGGYIDTLCPLTLDHEALSQLLGMIQVIEPIRDARGRIISNDILDEENATAIGDALVSAVERLDSSDSKSKVAILLSDGLQNTGAVTAEEAAELAKNKKIRVYTIGIGSTGTAPFPVLDQNGNRVYISQGVELDETTLKKIAEVTGGEYYNARDTKTLERVCQKIDELEKTEHSERIFTKYEEFYPYWLLVGCFFTFLALVLKLTWLRIIP